MKLYFYIKTLFVISLFTLCTTSFAQTVRVIDNKGTLIDVNQSIGNVAEIYDAAGGQIITEGTFSNINFATAGIVDSSDFTISSNSITITKAGRYEITYRVSPRTANNERNGGEFYLEVSGAESPGTRAYTYNRNDLIDKNTVTVTKIITATGTSTIIRVKGTVYASTLIALSPLTMVANGSSLIVKRIK